MQLPPYYLAVYTLYVFCSPERRHQGEDNADI